MSCRRAIIAIAAIAALASAACEEHTVSIRFEPAVGDEFHLRSSVDTEIVRTVDGDTEVDRSTSDLDATETILAVNDEEITVEVRVERDGSVPRTYEVRFDPRGHLSAFDLVEGVPARALGIDLTNELPSDLSSPPVGPLEPGASWTIDRLVDDPDRDDPYRVSGTGRLESLGVEDGVPTGVVVVEVAVPLRSVTETADGQVTVRGRQRVRSRTSYSLDDGTARSAHTEIRGDVDVLVEPPEGIEAPPVPGSIRYAIDTETERVPSG